MVGKNHFVILIYKICANSQNKTSKFVLFSEKRRNLPGFYMDNYLFFHLLATFSCYRH